MGLDITAYDNARYVKDRNPNDLSEDEQDSRDYVVSYAYRGFEQSTRGLVDYNVESPLWGGNLYLAVGLYDVSESDTIKFQAGSYSGYGAFRELLASVSGVTAKSVWDNKFFHIDLPFFELINFADNEGCVGPAAALDLYEDFVKYRDKFVSIADDYDVGRYDQWTEACKFAVPNGMIVFH